MVFLFRSLPRNCRIHVHRCTICQLLCANDRNSLAFFKSNYCLELTFFNAQFKQVNIPQDANCPLANLTALANLTCFIVNKFEHGGPSAVSSKSKKFEQVWWGEGVGLGPCTVRFDAMYRRWGKEG